jgi:hypothetical protein
LIDHCFESETASAKMGSLQDIRLANLQHEGHPQRLLWQSTTAGSDTGWSGPAFDQKQKGAGAFHSANSFCLVTN